MSMAVRPTAGAPRDSNMIFTFETLMRLDNGNPWAFRCSLNACVKTYGANISESTLEEHVLDTQPVLYDQRSEGYILATDRTLRKGVWNDCKSTNLRTNTNSIAYHFSTDPSPNYGSTFSGQDEPKYDNGSFQFYPPNCLWSYSYNAAYALEAALRRQFFNVRNLTTVHDDFYALQTIDPAWLVKLYNGGRANWDCKSIYGRSRGGHYRQHAGEGRAVAEWECRGYDSWIADLYWGPVGLAKSAGCDARSYWYLFGGDYIPDANAGCLEVVGNCSAIPWIR